MVEITVKVSQEVADRLCSKSDSDKYDLAMTVQSILDRELSRVEA